MLVKSDFAKRFPKIETAIALGREPGGGLVVMPDIFTYLHRTSIYWRRPETTDRRFGAAIEHLDERYRRR